MVTHTVGHALDEKRLRVLGAVPLCMLNRRTDGENVIAVDAEGSDAVARPTRGNSITSILLRRGRRDGKAVVSHDEAERRAGRL